MPIYFQFNGIKIVLYFNEHNPPHFHAMYAEYEALIEINSLSVFRGKLPKKKEQEVLKWVKKNQKLLVEIWNANHPA